MDFTCLAFAGNHEEEEAPPPPCSFFFFCASLFCGIVSSIGRVLCSRGILPYTGSQGHGIGFAVNSLKLKDVKNSIVILIFWRPS